jgi:hypothetical protein
VGVKKILQCKTIARSLACPLFVFLAEQMAAREVQTSTTAVARTTLARERGGWQKRGSMLL